MTAPFSGEDLVKRSLFSSFLNFKIKTPRFQQQQVETPASYSSSSLQLDNQQPCSSRSILQPQSVYECPQQRTSNEEENFCNSSAGDTALSEQMADCLMLASPAQAQLFSSVKPNYQVSSPQDIYREIVCECQPLEGQQQQFGDFTQYNNHQLAQLSNVPTYPPPQYQALQSPPEVCPNCHHHTSFTHPQQQYHPQLSIPLEPHQEQKLHGLIGGGGVSLEELVKIVVAAVKDVSGINRNKEMGPEEAPEEILRRKRQQNNEAAARYRKRQREAKIITEDEIDMLNRRNAELRREIEVVQLEISSLKSRFSLA